MLSEQTAVDSAKRDDTVENAAGYGVEYTDWRGCCSLRLAWVIQVGAGVGCYGIVVNTINEKIFALKRRALAPLKSS